MGWAVTIVGSIMVDDIVTSAGSASSELGGSALYAALAAAHYATVNVVGVAGSDIYPRLAREVARSDVSLSDVEERSGVTHREAATHDLQTNETTITTSNEGVAAGWLPLLSEKAALSEVLFLGSLPPRAQLAALTQSSASVVGVDSMVRWLKSDHDTFDKVLARASFLFLTREEIGVAAGSPVEPWLPNANVLLRRYPRLLAVVAKHGPDGVACVTRRTVLLRPATPVGRVLDPSGAGDALAGAFLGACAGAERVDESFFLGTALLAGLDMAAAAIQGFGLSGLTQRR